MKVGILGATSLVFQHNNPQSMSRALSVIVHDGAGAKDAAKRLVGS